MTNTRSSRPSAATLRTTASARGVARTFTRLQPDDLVPELLLLRGRMVHADVLRLEVLLEPPVPVLAADPGLLVAAERRGRRDQVIVVHPHGACADPFGHLQGPR